MRQEDRRGQESQTWLSFPATSSSKWSTVAFGPLVFYSNTFKSFFFFQQESIRIRAYCRKPRTCRKAWRNIKITPLSSPEITLLHFINPFLCILFYKVGLMLAMQFCILVVVWGFFPPTSFRRIEIAPKISFNDFIRVNHMVGNMNSESAVSSLIAASPVLSCTTMDKLLNFPQASASAFVKWCEGKIKRASYAVVVKRKEVIMWCDWLSVGDTIKS